MIARVLVAILVSLANQVSAGVLVECRYSGKKPMTGLQSYPDCATMVSGKVTIVSEHLQNIDFGPDGFVTILVSGQNYYMKPTGELLPVLTFDNGADYFSEGLVRSSVDGKIAFYDSDFNQAIPPKYDWAWPFDAGRALVCLGCTAGAPDADNHITISGGTWGYINRQGVEVVPVKFSKEAAQQRQ